MMAAMLRVLLVCGASAGWFGPGEFQRSKKLDLHLRAHHQHREALNELENTHGVKWQINDMSSVSMNEIARVHEMLDQLRADKGDMRPPMTDGKISPAKDAEPEVTSGPAVERTDEPSTDSMLRELGYC